MSSNIWVVKIKHKDMDFEHFSVELLWLSVTMAIDRFVIPIISIFAAEDHGERKERHSKFGIIKIHQNTSQVGGFNFKSISKILYTSTSHPESGWKYMKLPSRSTAASMRISTYISVERDRPSTYPGNPGDSPREIRRTYPAHPPWNQKFHSTSWNSSIFPRVFNGFSCFFQPLLQPFEAMNIPASRLHRHQ